MNYYIVIDKLGNYNLAHSLEWKQHKYIRKEGNRYIYPEDLQKENKAYSSSINTSLGGSSASNENKEDKKEISSEPESATKKALAKYQKALAQMQMIDRAARIQGRSPARDPAYINARAEVLEAKAELDRLNAEELLAKMPKKSSRSWVPEYYSAPKEKPTLKEEKKQQDKRARTKRKSALEERLAYEQERQRKVDERKKRR